MRGFVPGLGDSRDVSRCGDANGTTGVCLGLTVLCSMV